MLRSWLLGPSNALLLHVIHVLWCRWVWGCAYESTEFASSHLFLPSFSSTLKPRCHKQTTFLQEPVLLFYVTQNCKITFPGYFSRHQCGILWQGIQGDLVLTSLYKQEPYSLNKIIIKRVFVPILVFGDSPFSLPPWLIKLVKPEYA